MSSAFKGRFLSLIPGHKHASPTTTTHPQERLSTPPNIKTSSREQQQKEKEKQKQKQGSLVFQANRLSTFIEIGELATALMKDLERIENLETGRETRWEGELEGKKGDGSMKSRGSWVSKRSIQWNEVLRRFEMLERKLREGSQVVEVMRGRMIGAGVGGNSREEVREGKGVREKDGEERGVGGHGGEGEGEDVMGGGHLEKGVQTDAEERVEKDGKGAEGDDSGSPGKLLKRKSNRDDLRSVRDVAVRVGT